MRDSHFDNHLRDTLYSHTSPVDTDKLWMGVEAGLQGRRKMGHWIYWLGVFLLLFFIAGLVYMSLPGKMENREEQIAQISEEIISEKAHSRFHGPNNSQHVKPAERDLRSDVNFSLGSGEEDTPFPNKGNRAEAIPTPPVVPKEIRPAIDEPAITKQDEKKALAQNFGTRPKSHETSASFVGVQVEYFAQADTHARLAVTNNAVFPNKTDTKDHLEPNLPETVDYKEGSAFRPNPSKIIPMATGFYPISGHLALPGETELQVPDLTENQENSRIFIQLSAGAGSVGKSISSLHSSFNQYANQRSQTENPLEYHSLQGSVGYFLRNGFYISGGLNRTVVNEHFQLKRENITTHEQTIITHIHVNAEGDSVFQTGTAVTTTHHSEKFSHYNKYTLIDIPVFLGYEWNYNRFTAGVEVGILWNFSLRTRGSMLTASDEIIRMEDSNAFRKHVNQNYAINLRFAYALDERFSVSLSPGVRFIQRSVLTMDQLDQHYRLIGVQAGLVYRIP